MPCYTVRTQLLEFKAENLDLLMQALQATGWTFRQIGQNIECNTQNGQITLNLTGGKAQLRGSNLQRLQDDLNTLKRGYSLESVKVMQKKQHWTLKMDSEQQPKSVKLKLLRRN